MARQQRVSNDRSEKIKQQAKTSAPTYDRKAKQVYVRPSEVDKANEALKSGVSYLYNFGDNNVQKPDDNLYAQALAAFNPGGTFVPAQAQTEIAAKKAANRSRYMDALDTSTRAGVAMAGSGTTRSIMDTSETQAIKNEIAGKMAAREKDRTNAGKHFRSVRGNDDYRDRVLGFDNGALPYGRTDTARLRYALDEDYRGQIDTFNQRQGLLENPYDNLKYLTDEERRDLQYYASRGEYDRANEYLDFLAPDLNARMQGIVSNEMAKLSEEQPAAGVLANIAASREAGMGVLPTIRGAVKEQMGIYEPVDTNSRGFRAAHMLRDTTEGVGNAAYNAAGGGIAGDTARFLAEAGLSAAQNASLLPMGGTAPLVFMGAQAAGSTALDTLESGGTATQALELAAASAVIESATEKIGIDNFFRISRLGKKGIQQLLKEYKLGKPLVNDLRHYASQMGTQMGAEGAEEMIAEVAGNIADMAIRGDNGEYAQLVQAYVAQGMSEEKAKARAFTDMYINNVLKAGAQGAVAGGMLGAGGAAIGTRYNNELTAVGAQLAELGLQPADVVRAAQQSGDKEAQEFARELSQKLVLGEEVSLADMGKLHLLSNRYVTSEQFERAEAAAQAEQANTQSAENAPATAPSNAEGEEQRSQNQPVEAQNVTKVASAEDVAPKATNNTESIETTAGQVNEETAQSDAPANATEEERAEVREATKTNMSAAMPTQTTEAQEDQKKTPVPEESPVQEEEKTEAPPKGNTSFIDVPNWIMKNKLSEYQIAAIKNSGVEPTIVRETEKAYRLRWSLEGGTIEEWFPKKVISVETAEERAAAEEAGRSLNVGDRVKTKADGEGEIVGSGQSENYVKVKLDNGKEKTYLRRTLTKIEGGEKNGKENVEGSHDEAGVSDNGGVREADAGLLAEVASEDVRGDSENGEPSGTLRQEGNGDAGLAVRDDAGRSSGRRGVGDSEGGDVPAAGEVETAEEEATPEEEEKPAFKRGDRVKTKAGEEGIVRSVKGDRVTIKTDEGKTKTFKSGSLTPVEETAPSAEERPDSVAAENSTAETEEDAAKPATEATDKGTEIFNRLVSSLNKGDHQDLLKGRATDGTYFAGTQYAMAAVPKETYDSVDGRELPPERLMWALSGAGERLTDVYRYTKEGGKTSPMYILRGASDKRVAVRQSFLRPFAGYDFYSSEMEGVKYPTVKAVDGDGMTIGFVLPFTGLDIEHIALEKLTKADLSKAPAPKTSPKKEKAPANSTEENNDANAEQRAEKEAEQRVEEEIKQKTETALQDPPRGNNFIIPAEGLNLPQGEKTRYKANVDAIRLLRKLQAEDRLATPEEQTALSKYVGWGGLSGAFDKNNTKWSKEYAELKELLTDEEYNAARRSTTNAHYTEVGVIRGIYEGLAKLGFEGGRLLEPSSGVGHFVGAMPAQTRPTRWTMVELDNITGNIAKYLYPNADVRVQGFEKAKILDNYMDAAISNVPFGNFAIADKAYPRAVTSSIHNYFFAKALDKARPGGLVVFITSRYTMDSWDSNVRKYIMGKADLLGAIRLPDTAFKGNAGTDVVTDIIVLKKRAPGTKYGGEAFENANRYHTQLQIYDYSNEYFQNHPEMVLGEASAEGSMYRSNSLTYKAKNTRVSLGDQIAKAMENITGRMEYPAVASPEDVQKESRKAEAKGKNGGISVQNGEVVKNNNGVVKKVATKNEKEKQRLISIIDIRDTARNLLNLQLEGAPTSEIKKARVELNKLYDDFVKKYGFLNSPYNAQFLKQDVDAPFIRALEVWNRKEKTATKADIFSKDTVTPNVTATSCDTLNDAIAVSINETGELRPARIAELLGRAEADVTKELLDTEAAYKDRDGKLIPAAFYLSGNVRAKLREAETLAEGDKSYQRNVDALKKVIPKNIPYTDIQVQPGVTWIPVDYYSQFAGALLGDRTVRIKYNAALGEYVFESKGQKWIRDNATSRTEWGTPQKPFVELYEALLNNKDVRVYVPGSKSAVIDVEATEAAKEKMRNISDAFQTWLWKDTDRREQLSQLYNDIFNDNVHPVFDGSTFYVNGSNAAKPMREHQKNAVYRALMSGGNILLAHKVGAGKTYEMAAIAMKLRQLGLVKKPLFVVPKNLVAQWGNEFIDLFPAAKVLVAEDDAFSAKNRKAFINRMATGDFDAIICSQEQFKAIPLSQERQTDFYQRQITSIEAAIEEQVLSGERNPVSVKRMEKLKASVEAKMQKLADAQKDEDNIDFEDVGIDGLFVDEAHYYKNLLFQSALNRVAGLGNNTGSQRAFDLYMKVKYLQELNGGKGVCFATATPIMNSVAEMYTMQRYLHEDMLISKGVTNFDAWVKQFGEVTTEIEQTEKGKYREISVLSRFKNVPELQSLFRSFADVITNIPGLKIPKMKGGKRITVAVEPSDFQKAYMQKLADRAEAVRSGRVKPEDDNMLKITGEGRKLSYTQRMFDPSLPYEAEGKIMSAVKNIYMEWENSKEIKGTQLVFLDMGVPKAKENAEAEGAEDGSSAEAPDKAELSIYADMKNYLVGMGIPASEIAFIHDAKNDAQRKQLFADVNEGKVRVLLGSTGKMGVGMNAQKRIVAMHHMDAPWRPGDLEQREGRGLRQGNINDEVSVYVYVTKETIEETMWSRIHRKATFINQIMSGDISSREIKDEGDLAVSAAEIKAIASGNPMLVEQFKTSQELAKLETLRSSHAAEVASAEAKIENLKTAIATDAQYIEVLKEDIRARKDVSGDKFNITVGGKTFTERKEAGDALIKAVKKQLKIGEKETTHEIGSFAGFKLLCSSKGDIMIKGRGQYRIEANMQSASGTVQRLENLVRGLDDTLKKIEQRKKAAEKDLSTLEAFIEQPFSKQAELDKLRNRAEEIERQLAASAKEQEQAVPEEAEPEESAMYSAAEAARWNVKKTNKANEEARESKPLSALINDIQEGFGIQVTTGHIRGNKVLGRFNRRNKGIRIKNANDLVTAAHELGHALDERYGLREAVKADSKAKEEAYRAFDLMPQEAKDKYGKKARLSEGIAEYIRQFLSDRQTAEAEYPALTKIVLGAMTSKELAQFEQLADDINNYLANDTDTASSAIRFAGEETFKERVAAELNRDRIKQRAKDWWDNAYQKWVDSNHAIKRFDRETGANVYRFATNAAYSDARAKSIIEGGLYDMDANYIGESLASALSGVNLANKRTYREFGEYLVVKHGPERLREGMDVFGDPRKNTEEFMQKREAEIAEAHPEFVEAAKKLYKFQTDFLMAWGVESGLVSAEKAQEWAERWEFYVPFQRYMGDEFDTSRGAKRGFANQSSPYKKARGSGRDIIHPVDGIISNIIKTVNGGVRNDVFARLTRAAKRLGANATILEKIPVPLKRTVTDISEYKQAAVEDIWEMAASGLVEENAAKMGEAAINTLDDLIIQYGRGKAFGNVVTVMIDGKPEFWKINDPSLLDALCNLSPAQVDGILDAYGMISRFITSNLTGMNVIWSIFSNMPRDIATSITLSRNHNPVELIRGMASAYVNKAMGDKADPIYKEFLAIGGGHGGVYSADHDVARKERLNMTKGQKTKEARRRRARQRSNPLYWLENVSNAIESGPRFATYKYLREQGVDPHEAFYEAMEGTTNFRRGGQYGKQLNKAVPFFNAGVQGLDRFGRWLTAEDAPEDMRAKTAVRRTLMWVAVSAAVAGISYALNHADPDRDKDYEKLLSTYTKNNFFIVPLGNHKFFAIPKPREIAVLSSLFERVLGATIRGNKQAFYDFYNYFTDQCLPPLAAELAKIPVRGKEGFLNVTGEFGLFGVFAYIGANTDFLGRPIESQALEQFEKQDRYNERTSVMAKKLGEAFKGSPVVIDYFLQNTLGGFWKTAKALFPVDGENRDLTGGIVASYVKDPLYSTDIVNRIYDKAEASSQHAKSNPNDMDAQIAAKLDANMQTYYSHFFGLEKDAKKAGGDVSNARRSILIEMSDYMDATEDGKYSAAIPTAVYNAVKASKDASLLPAVMPTKIKDGEGAEHELSPEQYVRFQGKYLSEYYSLAKSELSSAKDKAETLKDIGATAKENATKATLTRMNLPTEKRAYTALNDSLSNTGAYKKANAKEREKAEERMHSIANETKSGKELQAEARKIGVNDNQYMELLIAADVADRTLQRRRDGSKNESQGNGSVTQDEYIAALEMTRLTREQKRKAFAAKWPKSKNNPYA